MATTMDSIVSRTPWSAKNPMEFFWLDGEKLSSAERPAAGDFFFDLSFFAGEETSKGRFFFFMNIF